MPASLPIRRILCYGHSPEQFAALLSSLARAPGCAEVAGSELSVEIHGTRTDWVACWDGDRLVADLKLSYTNLIVFDLRCEPAALAERGARALRALDALDRTEDIEERYPFNRILVLLGGPASPASDELVLRLGSRGVAHVVREGAGDAVTGGGDETMGARVAEAVARLLRRRTPGMRALCASGGGISGLFFELGALKCIDDCLPGRGVSDFDMYFGISAGAVVGGPLAVGYSIDEYMAAVAGVPGGRIPTLDLRLFRLGHLNWRGLLRRAGQAARTSASAVSDAVRGNPPSLEELFFEYADLVAPPFRADRFEHTLRRILEAPGATNDFRRLGRPLYVGATDQDLRRHVLFGDEHHQHVPISRAIAASLSINPAFSATPIDGRFYEDGAVTRTSNFEEAIRRGATLIVVLDPFVPFIAREPGFADRRGVLYNLDQDVRTVSYTRYETTRNQVLRRHPDVSSYTFVPANRLRRLMSIRPMDHRPFLEIWRGAYLSTWKRIQRVQHRLAGDFHVHGMAFEPERAEAVAARLTATERPVFADFFPDQRVVIRRPPLCLDLSPRPGLAHSA